MKYSLTMPSLGADMDEGKLLEWHIKHGDVINKGDLIAAVETQKAAVDIESFRAGKVLELIGNINDIISVGQIIATLDIEDTSQTNQPDLPLKIPEPVPTEVLAAEIAAVPAPVNINMNQRIRVSPAARRMAAKFAIDLTQVTGTGRDGAIEIRDIENKMTRPTEITSPTQIAKPTETTTQTEINGEKPVITNQSLINVRDAIARVMTRSKREIPHYYLKSQYIIDNLISWLDAKNHSASPQQRLFMPAVFMRAIVIALKTNPAMNGTYENGVFTPKNEIHLGITVALKPDGVMTPAILDAQNLSLAELNAAFTDLVQRARAGKLRNREMTDGTVTVTNVGDLGADEVTGIIFAPQVALIGLGRIHKTAIVDGDGGLRAGFVLNATLAADHRVTDGLTGSKLLTTLGRVLLQPDQLG